ncbi:hypothetical protein HGI30_05540 [Paenibacillus albicereus]|uniref:Uncharacterized protein n=1 Tax=Paenibacillus albicereus TaxID=2726185 RepID=A0A6H2GUK7_9BACL|nr:hypothetical protein [Paenibacillus albicereus]QJC51075.1 hypothetical protein HGI30_05540 [Paenibacillus albicereus]
MGGRGERRADGRRPGTGGRGGGERADGRRRARLGESGLVRFESGESAGAELALPAHGAALERRAVVGQAREADAAAG